MEGCCGSTDMLMGWIVLSMLSGVAFAVLGVSLYLNFAMFRALYRYGKRKFEKPNLDKDS